MSKPILFGTEMVQAIQDSRKTMTRRAITKFYDIDCNKPKKCPIDFKDLPKDLEIQGFEKNCALFYSKSEDKYYCSDNLKYHIGDKLWVRENWAYDDTNRELLLKTGYKENEIDNTICYKADYPNKIDDRHDYGLIKWKPSIFMPKKYARLHLVITDVRVERLQDISVDDIIKEGYSNLFCNDENCYKFKYCYNCEKEWWKNLWDNINKKRGFGWDKNPFVFVYEFKRIDKK